MEKPVIKLGWVPHSRDDGKFAHFDICILERSFGSMQEVFTLSWQSDADSGKDYFYGLRLKMDATTSDGPFLDRLATTTRLIRKHCPKQRAPREVIASLLEAKIPRIQYDGRLSTHVTEATCPAENLVRYYDDYQAAGNRHATEATLAPDAATAGREIAGKWAARVADAALDSDARKEFVRWLQAGSPVARDRFSRPAVFLSLDGLLFVPPPAVEAAA